MKKWIDFNTWPRYHHYLFFKTYEMPRFNMTFPLDVTQLYQVGKAKGYRFYFLLMHQVVLTLNQIENFRYRIEDGKVFDQPIEFVSFTDFIEAEQLFKVVFTKVDADYLTFEKTAIKTSAKQGNLLIQMDKEMVLNTIYITSFPWAKFTHFTHATKLSATDSVPRISWSQFQEENGKKILNFSVEVHHGLVDGYHVGLLINQLQKRLNDYR
jgi:chloramphenicol O-acetyltransferase type A